MAVNRLIAPVAAPPPPKPPQLSLVASAQMPDVAVDAFGPGAGPLLAAAGWERRHYGRANRRECEDPYGWDRPPGDTSLRGALEYRNALVAADIRSMDDLPTEQPELPVSVDPTSLPGSVFGATVRSRWTGGFAYAPENQRASGVVDPCGAVDFADPNPTNLPLVAFIPFVIEATDQCSAFGWSERDYVGRALRLLDNATPAAIEREFWAGAYSQAIAGTIPPDLPGANAFLQQSGTPTSGGTTLVPVDLTPPIVPSISRGIQILEDYLANTGFGGQGMLHVAPETSPNLLGARRVGALLLSVVDNIIVPGSGYPTSGATGPAGNANADPGAGNQWIYATDLVSVRLDEPEIFPQTLAEALDRGNGSSTTPNTIRIRAQRFGAVTFDGARLAACRVSLAT